ncbi:hypothetical protein DFQ27_001884 [Actinomortierella ambigua]|uniref:Cytochrome c oxidase assembly factor 6 n=1 Tax=Actinomortierella ambigua TaxID=1343610 RepID=A0A9P6QAU2_9FUNG|nr:hypothetical protein DFQ26_001167 [Actinomortierella ambigua]KAG0263198.1 hypothetical protein DFQ27_001884 [Actinomortierella ambigua]
MQEDNVKHPSRKDRQECWNARDAFFACLDDAKVVDPAKPEAQSVCPDLRKLYESKCMKSWADYFNKRRVLAVEQKDMLEQMRAQHKAVADRLAAQEAAAKEAEAKKNAQE